MTAPVNPETIDLDDEAVHGWFGLSYSNYAVQHRTLLQSMPAEWQRRYVACMEELDAAFSHIDTASCYIVTAAEECTYSDLSERDMAALGVTRPDGGDESDDMNDVYYDREGEEHESWERVLVPRAGGDPVPHYQRGRTRVEPRIDGLAAGTSEVLPA